MKGSRRGILCVGIKSLRASLGSLLRETYRSRLRSVYLRVRRRGVEMSMRAVEKKSAALTSNFPLSISRALAAIGWSDGTTSHLGHDASARTGKCTRYMWGAPACVMCRGA